MASATVQHAPSQTPGLDAATTLPPTGTSEYKPHNVQTTLNFFADHPDGSPPTPNYVGDSETYKKQPVETVPVTVTDVAGKELDYTLDKNGFQFYYHESAEKEFLDDEVIKAVYYPETERLLKDATGASRVFIFDHTIRRAPQDTRGQKNPHAATHLRGPPIFKDPLAVADAHSVPDSDLVPIKLIYPDREGETYAVRANPAFKWYYRYGQPTDLVTLIKCFDSKVDGRARRVPHSAFVNPETEGYDARESIEVRTLVFHEDDTE
ncbi:hypothetical protein BDV19DRAFT_388482 [Aspergillus venezuelensis]